MTKCATATSREFAAAAEKLLNTLGYRSKRKAAVSRSVADFMRRYPAAETQSAKQFRAAVADVNIVFQFAESEIQDSIERGLLPPSTQFKKGDKNNFLFVAADLRKRKRGYSRSNYADFVREINKRFNAPTVALFRRPESENKAVLTLAFVGRRHSRTQRGRDVLEKVSLLREIQCENPHRGHLDILAKLSLAERMAWLTHKEKPHNFDGLLAAWLDELGSEALNRRFYDDLLAWFQRVIDPEKPGHAVFPSPKPAPMRIEQHAIRMISRILFIWFLKEKGLVDGRLFEEKVAERLLKPGADDSYYRAVLQNLFFATLNTPVSKRAFRKGGNDEKWYNPEHGIFGLYRYENLIADKKKFECLMAKTPFVNGGLFDCLDVSAHKKDGKHVSGWRVDCFTDHRQHRKLLSVPDALFFDDDSEGKPGLFAILGKYKFTVQENTPVEQEVALDPELLGNVFEKLLGFLNRGEVGAYYTPRSIVEYMTCESLARYFAAGMASSNGKNDGNLQDRLRLLLSSEINYHTLPQKQKLSEEETEKFVNLAGRLRLLDPAVGSGAFPMGALALLTMAFNRIDPDNSVLRKREMARAKAFETKPIRDKAVELVRQMFSKENRLNDYGRKLSLIRNNIFGVDILPEAVQICRLRFFISLAIEQQANDNPDDNFGIRPLPNLETRFVAADALIGIGGVNIQDKLGNNEIKALQGLLAKNRERHFNAGVRKIKIECHEEDKRLRDLLAKELASVPGLEPAAIGVAKWNPYDQNTVAGWFDSKWMFGIDGGFDVVIGNPPYILIRSLPTDYKENLRSQRFASFHGTGDMYMLFYEKGLSLSKDGGSLSFITSNTWMRSDSGAKLRRALTENSPRYLINMGDGVFDNVTVSTNILLIHKGKQDGVLNAADLNRGSVFPPTKWIPIAPKGEDNWVIASPQENSIADKIRAAGIPISQWNSKIHVGIFTGYNPAFVIDSSVKKRLCSADSASAKIIFPVLYGKDIRQYAYHQEQWVIVIPQGWTNQNRGQRPPEEFFRSTYPAVYDHLHSFADVSAKGKGLIDRDNVGDYWWELRPCAYYSEFAKPKLVWSDIASKGQFAYDEKNMYLLSGAYAMTGDGLKYLLAVLNSSLINHQMRRVAVNLGNRGLRWRKAYVEKLRIPRISKAEQRPFVALAEKITAAKAANPSADTSKMEAEIDKMVYDLYRLNKDERKIIESSVP